VDPTSRARITTVIATNAITSAIKTSAGILEPDLLGGGVVVVVAAAWVGLLIG
jgi:hypothetical protein